jgi:hypothetical protein
MNGPRFALHQRMMISLGILGAVSVIIILQLWLYSATLEAFLGGNNVVALPGFLASAVCLLLNVGLVSYLRNLDR